MTGPFPMPELEKPMLQVPILCAKATLRITSNPKHMAFIKRSGGAFRKCRECGTRVVVAKTSLDLVEKGSDLVEQGKFYLSCYECEAKKDVKCRVAIMTPEQSEEYQKMTEQQVADN